MPVFLANLLWASPLWAWAGIAAVGLPVLIHLLSRRRYRPVAFPAARFVAQAASQAAAVDRPRHWLLLVLRVVALLLVIAAFMQPIWQPPSAVAVQPGQSRLRVILIDASASMRRVDAGVSAFDQALNRADQLIADLTPGQDRAMVYLLTDQAKPLLPEPTARLSALRQALTSQQPTWFADDASAVAATAQHVQDQWPSAELIWLTDGQSVDDVPYQTLSRTMQVQTVGNALGNTSVQWVDIRPYPPVMDQPFRATLRVEHHGPDSVELNLLGEFGSERLSQSLRVEPGGEQSVRFEFLNTDAAEGWLTVGLGNPDAFPADDQTGFFVTQAEARAVLMVTPNSDSGLSNRWAWMLHPKTIRTSQNQTSINLKPVAPGDLVSKLGQATASSTLVIAGLETALSEGASEAIATHLERGGGVVYFADTAAARQSLSDLPSPIQIDPAARPSGGFSQSFGQLDLPELRVFEGPSRELLAAITWPGVAPAQARQSGQAILSSKTGQIIVARQPVGRGTLYVINADPAADRSSLTIDPGFIVLFNELVRLAPSGEQPPMPLQPGDSLASADAEATGAWSVGRAVEPGPVGRMNDGRLVAGRWVELDLKESNLFAVSPSMVLSPSSRAQSEGDLLTRPLSPIDEQVRLWPYLLLAALGLLAAEAGLLVAHRQGVSHA